MYITRSRFESVKRARKPQTSKHKTSIYHREKKVAREGLFPTIIKLKIQMGQHLKAVPDFFLGQMKKI
jgi:hypothetical protein